jgi:hypothetical protein
LSPVKSLLTIPVRMFDRTRDVNIVGFGEDTGKRVFLVGMDDEMISYELWSDGVAERIAMDDTATQGSFDPELFSVAVGKAS